MAMQVAGSDWKLVQEGQSAEANQEPQFSTWEDVVNKKKAKTSGGASQSSSDAQSGSAQSSAPSFRPASTDSGRVFEDTYYRYFHGVHERRVCMLWSFWCIQCTFVQLQVRTAGVNHVVMASAYMAWRDVLIFR